MSELVPIGDESPFALLQMDPTDAQELLKDALGGESLSLRDLDRIKVPGSGGQIWEIPSIDGDTSAKEIEGIIIHRATARAYWEHAYGEGDDEDGNAPTCYSDDGEIGIGTPGGDCAGCPFNEFGTAENGNGKACKETRQLFVLTQGDILPYVLTIPPASLANVKAYFLGLLRKQQTPDSVVTRIGLTKVENKQKIKYSKVTFERGGNLSPEARQMVKAYAASMAPAFARSVRVDREDVDE